MVRSYAGDRGWTGLRALLEGGAGYSGQAVLRSILLSEELRIVKARTAQFVRFVKSSGGEISTRVPSSIAKRAAPPSNVQANSRGRQSKNRRRACRSNEALGYQ